MATVFRARTLALFLGDILFFVLALWVSLFLRTLSVPPEDVFINHLLAFSFLFATWTVIFVIAGLYESRSIILARRALSVSLLAAQTFNIILAALFFFLLPYFDITPKFLLIIYLLVSFLFIFIWRVVLFPRLWLQRPENAIIVGNISEAHELAEALNRAHRAPARVATVINPEEENLSHKVANAVEKHKAKFIIADLNNTAVSHAFPELYNFLSSGIRFFDVLNLYEQVFERIPLSNLDERWIARNISRYSHTWYDSLKRGMDIALAGLGVLLTLVVYPFVAIAIKLDDGGPIFITQTRVGEDNRPVRIYKFRSMRRNDTELTSQVSDNKVTRVGRFLRMTRLDEVPQLWNVVRGDLSLIGPRPELPSGVALYEKEIPYYGMRHLIKPGLSGWAQLYHDAHPHHAVHVEATREKLSYDLYYLKHRSLLLDLIIALKTFKKLLTRSGV